ncbi:MAG TPA: divalent-cation tolerance protein CutA [archaeon]|nr:divalent-cation tolerance protein CutA [archaeon]
MSLIFVYVTNPSKDEARKIAGVLIKKKLIACTNIFPIESVYPWKGKIANEKEFVLIGKTYNRNYKNIVKEVEKVHPYEVPCIAKLPVTFNDKYEKWLKGELR